MINEDTLLKPAEFADALGITVSCVRRWIYERRIANVKVGRLVRIPATEIQRIVETGTRLAKGVDHK